MKTGTELDEILARSNEINSTLKAVTRRLIGEKSDDELTEGFGKAKDLTISEKFNLITEIQEAILAWSNILDNII